MTLAYRHNCIVARVLKWNESMQAVNPWNPLRSLIWGREHDACVYENHYHIPWILSAACFSPELKFYPRKNSVQIKISFFSPMLAVKSFIWQLELVVGPVEFCFGAFKLFSMHKLDFLFTNCLWGMTVSYTLFFIRNILDPDRAPCFLRFWWFVGQNVS